MDIIFHSIFVWPIQAVVEFLYVFLYHWADLHLGVTIVLLSLAVNVLILPLYLVADRWQKEEKDLLHRMASKLADIRAVFRGDERHMMIRTYYRQMGYRPLLSLRSSVGLLIQIPFFLAAYNVLSHGNSVSVSIIQDLSLPDRLVSVGGLSINVLPLIMTAINLLSALIYAKNMSLKDNVQLFVLSAVFLVLLYNSPSGLVLYWTFNNLFSLGKNLVLQRPRPGRLFHRIALLGVGLLALWSALVVKNVTFVWVLEAVASILAVAFLPRIWRLALLVSRAKDDLAVQERNWFRSSGVFLFILSGLAIPLLFVAASPLDVPDGRAQIFRTALQMFSMFVLLPAGLWALASGPVRRFLGWGLGGLAILAAISSFVFPPMIALNASFTLTDPQGLEDPMGLLITAGTVFVVILLVFFAVRFRRVSWLTLSMALGSFSLVLVSVWTAVNLPPQVAVAQKNTAPAQAVNPVFHLSKSGHNQFMIFIDGFPAPAFPEMLATAPGVKDTLEGFTWYANTVSYAPHTFQTTPAMMGGPAYTPDAINARPGVPLGQKHNEALRVMPSLFSEAGERVVLTDPGYISYDGGQANSMYSDIPRVEALDLHGVYSDLYFKKHPYHVELSPVNSYDYDVLARFSLFRMSSPLWRPTVYNDGSWWIVSADADISNYVSGGYPNLVFLTQLCQVDNGPGTANFFFNEVFHDIGAFDPQGQLQTKSVEVSAEDLNRYGNTYSARNIYDGRVIMTLVAHWLEWLKKEGAYDQTRVMIVADHGHPLSEEKFGTHPWYRPLILFKDYDTRGPLKTNEDLKTNADVPSMLTQGMDHAVPPRQPGDLPVIHDGRWAPNDQKPDQFVFSKTMSLTHPDSRVASNWVEERP